MPVAVAIADDESRGRGHRAAGAAEVASGQPAPEECTVHTACAALRVLPQLPRGVRCRPITKTSNCKRSTMATIEPYGPIMGRASGGAGIPRACSGSAGQ